ncbi:hypothetical protein [Motilibacter deserti]|uniref:Uncharacterized protein n=1 Tax=Motilibacter deserti TaxID=2714956 RepID=A0ABX0GRL3_9ACTN|nr:hypothetical protein [Motilibacter deserti]NHC12350.1 hypothetical protein [Motilibacter deserti]
MGRRTAVGRTLLALALAGAPLAAATGPAYAEEAVPRLSTDATGPLFALSGLAPGWEHAACLQVRYAGLPAASALGVFATAGGSGLADYLDVRVERGTGGGYGDCTGFAGHQVFAGTLAELAAAHGSAAAALPDDAAVEGSGSAAYRIALTLRDDDGAQGRTAEAAFSWVTLLGAPPAAQPDPPPAPVVAPTAPPAPSPTADVPPAPTPSPSASRPSSTPSPTGRRPAPPAPDPASTPTVGPTAKPTPSSTQGGAGGPSAAPAVDPAGPPSAGPGESPASTDDSDGSEGSRPAAAAPPGTPPAGTPAAAPSRVPGPQVTVPLGGSRAGGTTAARNSSGAVGVLERATVVLGRAASATVAVARRVAAPAGTGAAVGIGMVPLLGGFLLIQRRLDDRDPKLALAPLAAAPDLTFDAQIRGNDE